jgi:hypothetical protein
MTRTTDDPRERAQGIPRWSLVLLIATVGVTSLTFCYLLHDGASSWLYARAYSDFSTADAAAADAADDYLGLVTRADSTTAQSDALEAVADPAYAGADAATALAEASDEFATTLADAPDGELAPFVGVIPPAKHTVPAWDRYADAAELLESRELRLAEIAEFEAASREIASARALALDSQEAIFAGLAATGEQAIADHPSATYRSRIGVQHAIDQSGEGWTYAHDSASAFSATVLAIDELRASHAAEEARRLEPEYPVRAEIEAFARSIAGGVNLDFVWAHEVNGLSSDEWYSGTAEFLPSDGGWGTISLTHSVSDNWSDDINAKAVVVHEVGHTQAIRPTCEPLFSGSEFAGDHEMWATAWAIGMGYDVPGSGIEAYGRPSDAQIAVASGCR